MTDPVVDKIVAKMYGDDEISIELHEEGTSPYGAVRPVDTKQYCTCGFDSRSKAELWKHQADSLREQLRQLIVIGE